MPQNPPHFKEPPVPWQTEHLFWHQIEEQRRQETERAGKAIEDRQAARAELKKTEKELRTVAAERKAAADALAEVAAQKQEAISRQARLELDVKELEEKSTADKLTQVSPSPELDCLSPGETGLRTTSLNSVVHLVNSVSFCPSVSVVR